MNPRSVGSAVVGELGLSQDGNIFKIRGLHEVWEWKSMVASHASSLHEEFVDSLIEMNLIDSQDELDDSATVSELVLKHPDALAKAYDEAVKTRGTSFTRNLTSLMLYSGPPLNSPYYAYRSRGSVVERAEIGAWSPRPGWLGLGDADLRSRSRLNDVNSIWSQYKPHVSTFAPAHHGSKHDWHSSLANGFGVGGDYTPTFVFSASGAWGHPAHEVLLEINELGGTVIIVGLEEPSRWSESMTVFVGK